MKKILKLSIVLLGALFVLLGCRSESKSVFVLQTDTSKVTYTYVYDKENDTVFISNNRYSSTFIRVQEFATETRQKRDELVNQMKDIEGVKVTSSDGENAIGFTIEIDVKKVQIG